MPITVNACGIAQGASGASIVLNSAANEAADIPVGSLIVISVTEISNAAPGGSVSDSAGNTYTPVGGTSLNNTQANGFVRLFYAFNCIAVPLTGLGTITYTKAVSGGATAISALYATIIKVASDPIDSTVTATAFGAAGSVTVTSGTPSISGDLLLAVFGNSNGNAFTQDTGHGWAVPPSRQNRLSVAQIAGGTQVKSGTTTTIFNPTIATSNGNWALILVGFKADGVVTNKSIAVTSTQAVAVVPAAIRPKAIAVVSTQAVALSTRLAKRVLATITSAQSLSMRRLVSKTIAVSSTQSIAIRRAMARSIAVTSDQTVAVVKKVSKQPFVMTLGQAVALQNTAGKRLAVVSTQTIRMTRQIGKNVAVRSVQVVRLFPRTRRQISIVIAGLGQTVRLSAVPVLFSNPKQVLKNVIRRLFVLR